MVSAPLSASPVPNASGRRNDDFDVRIVDDNDTELRGGRSRRDHLSASASARDVRGLLEAARRPPLSLIRNLWFHTGDMGKFDAEGNFYFMDRKKDYLRRRGENISSYEMEYTLLRHSELAEVAVHAVPSDLTEDDVKVTAVLTPGSALTEEVIVPVVY